MTDTQSKILTIPTVLTLIRLVILPLIICCIYADYVMAGFILYVFAALTDFLDGWLARKLDAVTPFGTFLDPISDKIFVGLLLLVFIDVGYLGGIFIIFPIVIIAREFLISGLREFLGGKNIQVPVTAIAKWKTTLQMVALGLLILAPYHILVLFGALFCMAGAALATFITGWLYMQAAWPHLRDENV
ncbi:MAG: CDP-diacylglycerol--glycerol-3-phosphate 3-phosphatidyltransferase [Alphaproteobacteria bacterium]